MLSFFLLVLTVAAVRAQGTPSCGNSSMKLPLHIAYFTTKSGIFVSSGTIPSVDLALERINQNDDVLPGYILKYEEIYKIEVGAGAASRALIFDTLGICAYYKRLQVYLRRINVCIAQLYVRIWGYLDTSKVSVFCAVCNYVQRSVKVVLRGY